MLAEIGADAIPQLMVYNKIDLLEGAPPATILRNEDGKIDELRVSAATGRGMDLLRDAIGEYAASVVTAVVRDGGDIAGLAVLENDEVLIDQAQADDVAHFGVD